MIWAGALVALACLALGFFVGRWSRRPPAPLPSEPERPARRFPVVPAAAAIGEQAGDAMRAALSGSAKAEPAAEVTTSFVVEAYGRGASDLREALIRSSGLPPELLDEACSIAMSSMAAPGLP